MNFQTIILGLLCFVVQLGNAQIREGNNYGLVKGTVQDSVHNHKVRLASVAIYDQKDSLINYTLTNQFGEFAFSKLSFNKQFRLVLSMNGYENAYVNVMIPESLKYYDCKFINLKPINKDNAIRLDEVVVNAIAPVKMNGDTLEFNADAFKLDTNAVVEDLVRRLPGFVVWGDGLITVNGKKVQRVLVGGKPFFGENANTALQNIPKNNVDKIQVYNVLEDKKNTLDSLTEVNIKLKAGKNTGLFGKISAGAGTNKRYVLDGMLNVFNPATQFGIVGTSNNTNAIAKDINALIQFNSFKGIGANIDYQPDFRLQGITNSKALGARFQHDFITDPSFYKNDRIRTDYLFSNSGKNFSKNTVSQISIDESNKLLQINNNQTNNQSHSHNFNTNYNKKTSLYEVDVAPALVISTGDLFNSDILEQSDGQNLLSRSSRENRNKFYKRNTNISTRFKTSRNTNRAWGGVELKPFSSRTNGYYINRIDHGNRNESEHKLSIRNDNIKNLLFRQAYLGGVDISVANLLSIKTSDDKHYVKDLDTLTASYLTNGYLTNKIRFNSFTYTPSIDLTKRFNKTLLDRFQESFEITLQLKQQLLGQKSHSEKDFQNFHKKYSHFIPRLSLSYFDHRLGTFKRNLSLEYNTKVDYPTLDQIAPLIDSSSLYNIQIGNSRIKNEFTHQIDFKFSHEAEKSHKDNLNVLANISIGAVRDKIADNIIFDANGRQTLSFINVDGYRFLNGMASLRKPVKLSKVSNLQLEWSTNFQLARSPSYINSILNISRNSTWLQNLNIYYMYKSTLVINAQMRYAHYKSIQTNDGFEFKNKVLKTSLNFSYNFNKSLTVTNNIEFNNNNSNILNQPNFTIWNASLSKRFLRGNNFEVKISALDLLRQNKGIIAFGNNSSFTTGTVSVLNNYYLITVSYFPRKF